MGHQRDLQIELPPRLRQRRHQREALGHRMKEERGESDLGGHPQPGDAARLEEARPDGASACLERPGQRESESDPQERLEPLRRQHIGQQVEGDHARRGRECKRPRPLQHRRPLLREQGDGASEECRAEREARRADHARQLRQSPRNSSRWPSTR